MTDPRSAVASGHFNASLRALLVALATPWFFGCQTTGPTPESPELTAETAPGSITTRQTAFRIRADFQAPLNGDHGWAAPLNQAATVQADEPFRLRFEVESPGQAAAGRQFQLQVRRNLGPWEALGAENFPQPAKKLKLDFTKQLSPTAMRAPWQLVRGKETAFSKQGAAHEGYLRLEAREAAVLALVREEPTWKPVEFAAILRFSETGPAAAGIVFGYQDADNYLRAELQAGKGIRLVRVRDGQSSTVATHDFDIKRSQWSEVKVIMEDSVVTLEYDDEALVFSEDLGRTIPVSGTGLFLPRGHQVDLASLLTEGEPRSPRTSIVASESFTHGAATTDLLKASSQPFTGGSGISFAEATPRWTSGSGQSEWEFPVVIRRFSDQAALNLPGDRFDYRLVDGNGAPLPANALASVTLEVPARHLGGTFVETPMRIGPWQAGNGDLYFLMEPSETWNALMTVKSSDGGATWLEMDGSHRPETGDLEGFASVLVGDRIHMVHQTSDDVWYHVFRTSDHPQLPDTWAIQDERIASPEEPPTQVADIAVRSDGSVVVVFGGPDKIHFSIRSADGKWSGETVIDAGTGPDLSGPALALGRSDIVHLAYTGSDGTAWYRQLSPEGVLSARTLVAEGLGTGSEDIGSVLPLVYLPESDTVSILYRLANGDLWERRVAGNGRDWSEALRVTNRAVAQNTVDSDQTGADAIAYGATVHCLFIDEASQQLFHTTRQGEGSWTTALRCGDDRPVQWVRGALVNRADGTPVYGYVIDAGAFGGSGKNRYRELIIPAPPTGR